MYTIALSATSESIFQKWMGNCKKRLHEDTMIFLSAANMGFYLRTVLWFFFPLSSSLHHPCFSLSLSPPPPIPEEGG